MAAPTPQAAGRLFAICPDVAELLAVKALGQGGLGFVCLYFNANMAEAGQFKNFVGFLCPREGD
jgi:hypothetical protein